MTEKERKLMKKEEAPSRDEEAYLCEDRVNDEIQRRDDVQET